MLPEDYYSHLRDPFTPGEVKLVMLFESPPVSGMYFYDPEGRTTEALYSAIMKLFGWKPTFKTEGLQWFCDAGMILLDATYQQVNGMTLKQRRHIMRADYPDLIARLPDAPVMIGMSAVYDAVNDLLIKDGVYVINGPIKVPFPANGRQRQFHEKAGAVLSDFGIA